FERVHAELGEKTNWSDSEDLSMMFRGTYTGDFYRALHEALHAEVDQWKLPLHPGSEWQEHKTQMLWKEVMQLEKTCRNDTPTVLNGSGTANLVQLQAISVGDGVVAHHPHGDCE
ncbi:MAG: Radical domain protein, partial [Acidobacteriaceae bacterium]|nr:Radical domain protein [Acidobacteriaceae bacterium]